MSMIEQIIIITAISMILALIVQRAIHPKPTAYYVVYSFSGGVGSINITQETANLDMKSIQTAVEKYLNESKEVDLGGQGIIITNIIKTQ